MSSPPTITNTLLHDYDVGSIPTPVAGNSVSSIPDKVTGGSLSQGTAAAQPTLQSVTNSGKTFWAAQFDGTDDVMSDASMGTVSQPNTVVLIMTNTAASGGYYIDGQTSRQAIGPGVSSGTYNKDVAYAGSTLGTTHVLDTSWHEHLVSFNGVSSAYYVDGTSVGSGNSGSNSLGPTLYLGNRFTGSGYLQGSVARVLIYSGAISTADRSKIDSWVQDTYGITVSDYVPSGGGSASVSDSIPLATSVTRSQSQSRSTADSISLSTATTSQSTQARSVADTLAASTSASSSRGQQRRSIADSLGLSTLVSRAASAVRAIADTLGLSSSAARSQTQTRSIADSVALSTSTTSTQTTQTRATSDSISLTTSVAVRFTPANAPRNLTFRVGQPTPRWKVGQPTPSWTVGQPRPRWKVSEPN